MIRLVAGGTTDVGQVREVNQDSFLTVDGLFAVADGMGGHRGGEVASKVAITTLQQSVGEASLTALLDGVQSANEAIIAQSTADPELRGMGTTICGLVVVEDGSGTSKLGVVNVGDSRVYRFWEGSFEQVTEDHSLVETLVREGRLTKEEALTHPQRNILTRALGIESGVEIDRWVLPVRVGERFLLCSDGLFNEVDDPAIIEVLASTENPQDATDQLVSMANASGARDNVTVVIVDVAGVDDDDAAPKTEPTPIVEVDTVETDPVDPATNQTPVVAVGAEGELIDADTGDPIETQLEPPPANIAEPVEALAPVDADFDDVSRRTNPVPAPEPADAPRIRPSPVDPRSQRSGDLEAAPLMGQPAAVVPDPAATAAEITPEVAAIDNPPRRWLTGRGLVWVLLLVLLIAVAIGGIAIFANSGYHIALEGPDDAPAAEQQVIIFKGQPDSILWFEPEVERRTGLSAADLADPDYDRVMDTPQFDSLDEAQQMVEGLSARSPGSPSSPS